MKTEIEYMDEVVHTSSNRKVHLLFRLFDELFNKLSLLFAENQKALYFN